MNGEPSWNQLSVLVYVGAMTVDKICNQTSEEKQSRSKLWFSSTYRKQIAEVAPTAQQLNNPLLLAWKQALPEHLTMDLWQRVVSKMKPWKAPGPDDLQSYWWKSFKTALLPQDWISNGRIILLFKSGSRSDPANYRGCESEGE
jgi:hypothetical protein